MVPVPVNTPSLTATPVSVTLPVLVTTKEYVTVCPAEVTDVGKTDLVILSAGAGAVVGVVVEDGGDVSVAALPNTVPLAVAVL